MQRFFEIVTSPVLRLRGFKRAVEIGSQAGESTRRLLELCGELGAHADIIDPEPPENLEAIADLLAAHGTFHRARSLDVLPTLPVADVYLIDGDHNWYTVFHELEAIEGRALKNRARAPLILLHDVAWPYGRRDLYYVPGTVPDTHQHPIVRGGLTPGVAEATPERGMNQHLNHAAHEGGPKNGVRTAIEDFVATHDRYTWRAVPGFSGLGFLVPTADLAEPYAQQIEAMCDANDVVLELLTRVERDRMSKMVRIEELQRNLKRTEDARRLADERTEQLRKRCGAAEQEIEALKGTRGFRALEQLRNVRRRLRR